MKPKHQHEWDYSKITRFGSITWVKCRKCGDLGILKRRQFADSQKKIEEIEQAAINLIGSQLCKKHREETRKLSFNEFYNLETELGCLHCKDERVKELEENIRHLRKLLQFKDKEENITNDA